MLKLKTHERAFVLPYAPHADDALENYLCMYDSKD